MKKAVRIYITGIVQGVFFRAFAKESAKKNNVNGFIRNLNDGRVEIFAEGNIDDVNKMVEECKTGPKHSKIENFEVKDDKFQGFKEFKVLHI